MVTCIYHSISDHGQAISDTMELKEIMCGEEAATMRNSLDIKYPVRPSAFVCVCAYMCVCIHVCIHVCMYVHACVHVLGTSTRITRP